MNRHTVTQLCLQSPALKCDVSDASRSSDVCSCVFSMITVTQLCLQSPALKCDVSDASREPFKLCHQQNNGVCVARPLVGCNVIQTKNPALH